MSRKGFLPFVLIVLIHLTGFGQELDLKKPLVDFFKNLTQLPEIEIKAGISSNYPSSMIDNNRGAHFYVGTNPSDLTQEQKQLILRIVQLLMDKSLDSAVELFEQNREKLPFPALDLLLQGEKAIAAYEYDRALELLTRCIDMNPNNEYAYYLRAKLYNSLGRKNEARQDLITTLTLNPLFAYYQMRNKYLLTQLNVRIKPRWFFPKWQKTENSYQVENEVWKYYVQSLMIFKNYSTSELKEFTGISNRELALHVLAINIMLHYARLNSLMDDDIKKIEKIMKDDQLKGFVLVEILPYFPDNFTPVDVFDILQAKKYFEKFYLD